MLKIKSIFYYNLLLLILVSANTNHEKHRKDGVPKYSYLNIGVVIGDLHSAMGAMVNSCMWMAHSEYYSAHPNHRMRLDLRIKDAHSELDQHSAVIQLLEKEEVLGIIRPQWSTETSIIVELANRAHVPIISFSGRSQSFSSKKLPYFVQMMPDNFHRARALAATFDAFELKQVAVLYQDTDDGNEFISQLHKAFQDNGLRIAYMLSFPTSIEDSTLMKELRILMAMHTRIFLVHVGTSLGCQLFPLVKQIGMMSKGYAWFITDILANHLNSIDTRVIESMEGVIGIKVHVPKSRSLEDFERRWTRHIISMLPDDKITKLNVYGVLAYDAIWTLAMAAEKIGTVNSGLKDAQNDINTANFRVSTLGPKLLREILQMKFMGLSGDIELDNGQLKLVAFEIFNRIGSGEKKIGKWKPKIGLTQKLGSVIWPGDSQIKPLDLGLNKLRIIVPMKEGFPQFVSVPHNSPIKPTGISMDIFYAVLELLPLKVDYDLFFYPIKRGNCTGSYDDLLHKISENKYDIAIGDITILDDRAPKLEYTQPYMASEIVMMVKNVKHKDIWILFKVWSWDVWITIIAAYISVGTVVCILQHQINGLLFWFPLAVLALPESNMVVNRWTAFVLVVSFAMGSIIIQCYMGQFSAMVLSDWQEQAVPKDFIVGYQEGSFVKEFLIKKLNLNKSRLRAFSSIEEFHDAMTKGSKDGGVDVIYDESPYAKLMLRTYGSVYKIVGPTYKTGGFGFAIREGPISSLLLQYFSEAILKVTQSDRMVGIEERNFGPGYSNGKGGTKDNGGPGLPDFIGPFLIILSANLLALFFSETTAGRRFASFTRKFSQRGYSIVANALVRQDVVTTETVNSAAI